MDCNKKETLEEKFISSLVHKIGIETDTRLHNGAFGLKLGHTKNDLIVKLAKSVAKSVFESQEEHHLLKEIFFPRKTEEEVILAFKRQRICDIQYLQRDLERTQSSVQTQQYLLEQAISKFEKDYGPT